MKDFKIGLFIAISIACLDSSSSQQITCKETITFERGERGVVSCQYNMNFIAVFWYRGDADNPFLRLEEGRPTTSERFSIAPNGTMIIESVEIRDEGVYRISVLDENGVSLSEHLYVKVTVSLSTAPVIENCATSESELCQDIKEEKRENVLVCETVNTRPKVNLTWWRLSSSGDSYMSGLSYNASLDQSTELFTSLSVFQFDPKMFSVGYFTCKATGEAVRSQKQSSLFVQGLKETAVKTKQKEIVESGMTLELSCSDKTHPLLSWSFTQDDVTIQTLRTIYPGKRSGACLLRTACYVDDHGTLTVEEVTHKNEGFYECLYSDGDTSSRSAYEIDILIKPIPEEIVIDGCKNSTKCDKAVALTGTIEASVHGARPPVEILCGVADQSTAFIYNHESRIEDHPEEGTFDTFYSVHVDIDECSQPVHISCIVPHGSVHEKLPASNIYLITDTSGCSNQKGPWTAIILVILVFTIVAAITVLYFKRGRVRGLQTLCFSHQVEEGVHYTPVQQSESISTNATATSPARDKEEEAEKRENKNGEKHLKKFEDLYAKIQKNEIQNEGFRQEMDTYSEIKEGNLPQSFLSFVTEKDLYENKPWEVVKFVGGCVPCSQISSLEFVRKLADLVKEKKLAVDKFLNVCEEFCYTEKISKTNYMEITGPLVKCNAVSTKIIEKELANIEKVQANKSEWADWLLKYAIDNHSKDEGAMQTIIRESKLLPYPYFLQSTYKNIKKIDPKDKCFNWFKDIITSHLEQLENCLKGISDDKALSLVFVEALCHSVASQSIQSCTCVELLLKGRKSFDSMEKENKKLVTEERAIEDTEINEIFKKICKTSTVPGETCTEILYYSLEKNLIKEPFYLKQLEVLRNESKIEFQVYVNELRRCLEKQKITQQLFEENVTRLVEDGEWSKEQWVKLFVDITKQHLIADGVKVKLFRSATKTYEITGSQLKAMVKECGIEEEKVHTFLSGVKVHSKLLDHTLKAKEEKEENEESKEEVKEEEDEKKGKKGQKKGKEKKKEKKEDKEKKKEEKEKKKKEKEKKK